MKSWEEEAAEAENEKRKKALEAKAEPPQPKPEVVFKELVRPPRFPFAMQIVVLGVIAFPIIAMAVADDLALQGLAAILATVFGIIYVLSPIIALSYLRTIRNEIIKIREEIYRKK